jgi:hypothetical protein
MCSVVSVCCTISGCVSNSGIIDTYHACCHTRPQQTHARTRTHTSICKPAISRSSLSFLGFLAACTSTFLICCDVHHMITTRDHQSTYRRNHDIRSGQQAVEVVGQFGEQYLDRIDDILRVREMLTSSNTTHARVTQYHVTRTPTYRSALLLLRLVLLKDAEHKVLRCDAIHALNLRLFVCTCSRYMISFTHTYTHTPQYHHTRTRTQLALACRLPPRGDASVPLSALSGGRWPVVSALNSRSDSRRTSCRSIARSQSARSVHRPHNHVYTPRLC